MSISITVCVELVCDNGCEVWDDGAPHFSTVDEAMAYAKAEGWLLFPNWSVCPDCANAVDCLATGHQWTDWETYDEYNITYRYRYCDHCDAEEYDPPDNELRVLATVADIIDTAADTDDGPDPTAVGGA